MRMIDCLRARAFIAFIIVMGAPVARGELPPAPDNAALLYHQAMQHYALQYAHAYRPFGPSPGRADPNEPPDADLGAFRDVIEITVAATRVPQCSWGIVYSQGMDFPRQWLGELHNLADLLELDAQTLASNGHYREAFERVLSIRRLAAHLTNDTILPYLTALQLEYCLYSIQNILSMAPHDVERLRWLQAHLMEVQGPPASPGRAIERDMERAFHPSAIAKWESRLAEMPEGQAVLDFVGPDVAGQERAVAESFVISLQAILASERPYAEKRAELRRLSDALLQDDATTGILWPTLPLEAHAYYDLYVRHTAHFNAVRAGIGILLQKAHTGELPEALPLHLPKDPFSGEDFDYHLVEGGFTLRCRAEEIGEREIWEYEFKTP